MYSCSTSQILPKGQGKIFENFGCLVDRLTAKKLLIKRFGKAYSTACYAHLFAKSSERKAYKLDRQLKGHELFVIAKNGKQKRVKVSYLQEIIPNYRVPFFQRLANFEQVDLTVFTASHQKKSKKRIHEMQIN